MERKELTPGVAMVHEGKPREECNTETGLIKRFGRSAVVAAAAGVGGRPAGGTPFSCMKLLSKILDRVPGPDDAEGQPEQAVAHAFI